MLSSYEKELALIFNQFGAQFTKAGLEHKLLMNI